MSDIFNFGRFGKYFAYDIKSRWAEQRTFLLIMALLPVIFYLIYMFISAVFHGELLSLFAGGSISRPGIDARAGVFIGAAFLFLLLFPSLSYGFITDKAKGSAWLELPASRLEKFASMMLVCLVVIPVSFFVVYLVSDAVVCLLDRNCGLSLLNAWATEWRPNAFQGNFNGSEVQLGANGLWLVIAAILGNVSFFLLGALVFKRKKVGKTILVIFALDIVIFTILGWVISAKGPENIGLAVADWMSKHGDHIDFWFNLGNNIQLFILVVGCGLLSWLRIKNIQH